MFDYSSKAAQRLLWQYRNSPKFKQWIDSLPSIADSEIAPVIERLKEILDIDQAAGEQLDILARIAGINQRPRVTSTSISYFAYNGTPNAQPYNTAPYVSPGFTVDTVLIPDYLFRVVVRAKIAKNNSNATIDGIKESVDYIFDDDSIVVDGLDMTIHTILLDQQPAANVEQVLAELDLIPRPQGVNIRLIRKKEEVFAYEDTLFANPYDTEPYIDPSELAT